MQLIKSVLIAVKEAYNNIWFRQYKCCFTIKENIVQSPAQILDNISRLHNKQV